ncbi:MAG: homoserine dehydrogenase [Erysipelotrichaceae bacterium]|nr:homoserine dehydrogenase [Erysipelotrichaceae bacterium]
MIVGIIGLGTVGYGTLDILTKEKERLEKLIKEEIRVKYGCALENVELPEGVIYTTDYRDVINDEEVDVVVELIGGTTIAKTIILEAIKNGKNVVTANKALIAHHAQEIFEAARHNNVKIYYEASVGGGIPVVVPAKENLVANNILKIEGILNGTTNFILSLMETDNLDFDEALHIAEGFGYVEADASLDLDGIDAAHKIYILAMNAYETFFDFDSIKTEGIRKVTKKDMDYAKQLGYRIKLIAQAKKLDNGYGIDVAPTLVKKKGMISHVMQAYNVVEFTCDYLDNVIFYGKGAGRYVTASAVVSDIIKTAREDKWIHAYAPKQKVVPITKSRYYVRTTSNLDLDYDIYFSEGEDNVYITPEMERSVLDAHVGDAVCQIFKVRG